MDAPILTRLSVFRQVMQFDSFALQQIQDSPHINCRHAVASSRRYSRLKASAAVAGCGAVLYSFEGQQSN